MPLVEIHWNPTDRQLRQFAIICLGVPAAATWAWTGDGTWTAAAFIAGILIAIAGWARPQSIRPLFVGLSVLTAPLGIVVGEIVVLAIYLLVVTPIGLAMRACGKDPIRKRPNRSAHSYWEPHSPPPEAEQYFRQS